MRFARHFAYSLLLVLLAGSVAAADLAVARPESVGMSAQRLGCLRSEMQALVDHGQLSGVVTAASWTAIDCCRR